MPRIILFNQQTAALENYTRALNDPMPYNVGGTLTVGEFMAGFSYPIIYTDLYMMQAFNELRKQFGAPISVYRSFIKAPDAESESYVHFSGNAMLLRPVCGSLTELYEAALRCLKIVNTENDGQNVYIDTLYTSCGANADKRGLAYLQAGDRNHFVALLQDVINIIIGAGLAVDGIFGSATAAALRRFQDSILATADGICTLKTWESALNMAAVRANW